MREIFAEIRLASCAVLLLLLPLFSYGQGKDTAKVHHKIARLDDKSNILVVPYEPSMYNVTGDQFICQHSKMTPGELSDMIRRSLISTLMYNMNDLYNVIEPPNDLANKNSDLSVLYQITRFRTLYKKLKSYYKAYPAFKLYQILGPRYLRWGSDCVNDNAQKPNVSHHKFVKAELRKDSIYTSICKKYNSHYTLFITQFEMSTRFKNCLDLQNQVFQRDIFVHYTLLDQKGKYIDGGVVGTTYQSGSNDVVKILDKNLGLLTGLIIEEIRKKI